MELNLLFLFSRPETDGYSNHEEKTIEDNNENKNQGLKVMVTSSRILLSQFVNHTTDLSGQLRNITDISPGPLENPSGYLMLDCRLLVLTSCLFYFPTTMVVMYCYGTIYSSQKLILKNRCR